MKTTADVLVTEENRTGGILVVTGAETVPANPVTRLAFSLTPPVTGAPLSVALSSGSTSGDASH